MCDRKDYFLSSPKGAWFSPNASSQPHAFKFWQKQCTVKGLYTRNHAPKGAWFSPNASSQPHAFIQTQANCGENHAPLGVWFSTILAFLATTRIFKYCTQIQKILTKETHYEPNITVIMLTSLLKKLNTNRIDIESPEDAINEVL